MSDWKWIVSKQSKINWIEALWGYEGGRTLISAKVPSKVLLVLLNITRSGIDIWKNMAQLCINSHTKRLISTYVTKVTVTLFLPVRL